MKIIILKQQLKIWVLKIKKALYTINKIKDKDIKYQKNIIITMLNRAKYHPYKTKEMNDAIDIFKNGYKI